MCKSLFQIAHRTVNVDVTKKNLSQKLPSIWLFLLLMLTRWALQVQKYRTLVRFLILMFYKQLDCSQFLDYPSISGVLSVLMNLRLPEKNMNPSNLFYPLFKSFNLLGVLCINELFIIAFLPFFVSWWSRRSLEKTFKIWI